jgi:hypothetical protein
MTTTNDTSTKTGDMASTAKQETGAVAQSAAGAGKEVVSAVSERTAAVASSAKQQLSTVVYQTKSELRTQAEGQGQQVISRLRSLSDQVSALASGRPEEAGQVGALLEEGQQRLQSYLGSLELRGPQGMVDDVTRFARRRPGMFLLGAGVAGFAIGRLVRSAAAEQQSSQSWQSSQGDTSWDSPSSGVTYSASGPHATSSMSTPGYAPAATDMPLAERTPSGSVIRP